MGEKLESDRPNYEKTSNQRLELSVNTKTSQIVGVRTDSRGNHYPDFPNSFGLPSFLSCPGNTDFCKEFCYGVEIEGRTNVDLKLRRNLDKLRGKSEDEMYALLSDMMHDYQVLFDKSGLEQKDNFFRIHWDGDFFNVPYARAWRRIIEENQQTRFWVYTRSFREPVDVVPVFMDNTLPNLTFYLSVDAWNVDDAIRQSEIYPKILKAYCARTYADAIVIAEYVTGSSNLKRFKACPENTGELPIAVNGHGACAECQLCINSRPNIIFIDKKYPDVKHIQHTLDPKITPVKVTLSRSLREFDTSLLNVPENSPTILEENQLVQLR